MPMDIDVVERVIKTSVDEALRRMRQAEENLERAQRAGQARDTKLAEALSEYNRCMAELAEYLNVSSRHRTPKT